MEENRSIIDDCISKLWATTCIAMNCFKFQNQFLIFCYLKLTNYWLIKMFHFGQHVHLEYKCFWYKIHSKTTLGFTGNTSFISFKCNCFLIVRYGVSLPYLPWLTLSSTHSFPICLIWLQFISLHFYAFQNFAQLFYFLFFPSSMEKKLEFKIIIWNLDRKICCQLYLKIKLDLEKVQKFFFLKGYIFHSCFSSDRLISWKNINIKMNG